MRFYKGHKLSRGRKMGSKNKTTEEQLKRWKEEQDRIFQAMKGKDITSEDYRTLIDAADKAQKQIQLLSGGATERNALTIEISQEIANKNEINTRTKNDSD